MLGIPIAILLSNASEWVIHKYVLHGRGADKASFWSFHWHEHHRAARRGGHFDPDYERFPLGWHAQGKELLGLVGTAVVTAPLLPVAPWFVLTSYACAVRYYRLHKRAHLDPEWARQHLPWHYDHHMGPNQHANWCVTRPWFDHVMGTREPYVGTEREQRDLEKQRARAGRSARGASPGLAKVDSADTGDLTSPGPSDRAMLPT